MNEFFVGCHLFCFPISLSFYREPLLPLRHDPPYLLLRAPYIPSFAAA